MVKSKRALLLIAIAFFMGLIGLSSCSSDETVTYVPLAQKTATASSTGWGLYPEYVLSNEIGPFWHSARLTESIEFFGIDQHFLTLDLGGTYRVTRLVYQGRMDEWTNSVITSYAIYTSLNADGPFTRAASGEWSGEHHGTEYANFDPVEARFVRLVALASTSYDENEVPNIVDASVPYHFVAGVSMMRIGVLGQDDFDENYQ